MSKDYKCPGCIESGMADECWHVEAAWPLAEAMAAGVNRQHPGARQNFASDIMFAHAFIDGADAVLSNVGEPPWTVDYTHPGGMFATVGLVNGRYLIGVEEGGGGTISTFLGDLRELVPADE